ncbi:ParB N-terminal domain-containing protein [Brevundimonas sp.]|uniref:ParB/RepB/Spo0J family partition protein n=1 Tax=Brevundimonas sp. TaxID=1871086 RepID=UPI0022CB37ED|nr:ParB N-terminal domain-containing protein [Brevundimonas sp.]MCZ8195034.1 ParB N-terminal domain-containing protein [Brevundimonas sp.]
MTELNLNAIQNAPLLRLIEADPTRTTTAYAADLGRDKSNTAKSIKLLRHVGLIDDSGLTDAGREQLAAIARAEGGAEHGALGAQTTPTVWPYDKVRRNPANRPVDPDKIAELADAILGARAQGGLLQRALLTPPDANGVRMLLAGERRWLALQHLAEQGLLTDELAWLADGLPFEEREATDAEATLITIVENTSREGLNPLDDAEQLYRYQQLTGQSARQIAKLTGRSPADSNRGERDVQLKIKIAREATDQAKAEYRRTGSWDALRDSVTRAKPVENDAELPFSSPFNGVEGGSHASDRTDRAAVEGQTHADPETQALAGTEPITAPDTDAPTGYLARLGFQPGQRYQRQYDRHNPAQRVSDFAPDLPEWKPGESNLADHLDGPVETLMLPRLTPAPYAAGYPLALIEVAPLKGGAGWVYAAGYSTPSAGHHERMTAITPRDEAFPDRETAIAAGVDLILDSLGRWANWKYPAGLLKWLDAPTPPGPHVVNGIDYLNSTRAREARLDLGLEPRKANSGGGARQAEAPPAQRDLEDAITAAQAGAEDAEADALLARTRETLARSRDWGLIALSAEVAPLLKAAGIAGPYSTRPEFPGAICCGGDPMISIDPDGLEAEPAMVAAAELLAAILNRALGHADPAEAA